MYKDYNDYELIDLIADNNEYASEIIYKKYEPFIKKTARRLFEYCKNTGLEENDLIQEGMLGLNNAINTFTESKETLFYTYAKTCIERRIISAIIASRRLKHKILNESISIESSDSYGEDITLEFFLKDDSINPEKLMLYKEKTEELLHTVKHILTPLELQVFELKINGFNIKEISKMLDKDYKSIDNALQRIKNKIKKEA